MKVVDVVTIESLIPIFKNGEPANAIEVSRVKTSEGESCQYNIIVGKNLHKIGDKAIYIQPDHCLPDTDLFKEYIAPGGDPKKSKLGKKFRIRSVKFNFNFESESDPIYSNGVLLPYKELSDDLKQKIEEDTEFDIQSYLGITKYVSDDSLESGQMSGNVKGDRPSFLYMTDETTIENLKSHVERCYDNAEILTISAKRDGSSISEYCRKNNDNEYDIGICSRKQEKKLDQQYVQAYKENGVLLRKHYDQETKITGWFNEATNTFYTNEAIAELSQFEAIMAEHRDAWVDTDRKFGYLEKFLEYCKKNDAELVLRGELVGAGNKGSGNKLNQDAKGESKVIWFGVDDLSSGFSTRVHFGQQHNLKSVCEELGFEYTVELFEGCFTYDDIIRKGKEYFKYMKDTYGQIVEGIVIRSKYSNSLSVKYINPEYDANS